MSEILGDVPPPSWRTQIGNALYVHAGWPADQVNHFLDQLLAEHAHELAERARNTPLPMAAMAMGGSVAEAARMGINAAADSITPEADTP